MKKESFKVLARSGKLVIERIVSRGHKSPPGFRYDQDFDEFCLVLRGAARLRLAGRKKTVHLKEGDYLFIPAHTRHRVEWTRPKKTTIWLAIKGKRKPAKNANER